MREKPLCWRIWVHEIVLHAPVYAPKGTSIARGQAGTHNRAS